MYEYHLLSTTMNDLEWIIAMVVACVVCTLFTYFAVRRFYVHRSFLTHGDVWHVRYYFVKDGTWKQRRGIYKVQAAIRKERFDDADMHHYMELKEVE